MFEAFTEFRDESREAGSIQLAQGLQGMEFGIFEERSWSY